MDSLALISICLAVLFLLWMGWIDLKLWILPNELVVAFAVMSVLFHYAVEWYYGAWLYIVMGATVGGGSLWIIRTVANKIYGMETLGFGDIKLMAAGGLFLGAEGVLMAMSLGALCGVVHALIIVVSKKITTGHWVSMNRMALPAGPGFIVGIIGIGIWMYGDLLL